MPAQPSASVHSNAFNFLSHITGGIDPRTGLYTFSVALPQVLSNNLMGPAIPLTLGFNPLNSIDSGLGLGWSIALSQYNDDSQMLALSTGESYKATLLADEVLIHEQKLKSFTAERLAGGDIRITHKSGLVELLSDHGGNSLFLTHTLYSAEGRRVNIDWIRWPNGSAGVSMLSDELRVLLKFNYGDGFTEIVACPETSKTAALLVEISNGVARKISLPVSNRAGWHFHYVEMGGLYFIDEVRTPTGAVEAIGYQARGHALPNGAPFISFPYATLHQVDPGLGAEVLTTRFDYTHNNYFGYGAPGLTWSPLGDTLYKVRDDYLYGSTETVVRGVGSQQQDVRFITRVYNRFHLLVEERVQQGECLQSTTTHYHEQADLPFEEQPAQFQLPRQVISRCWRGQGAVLEEIAHSEFDLQGNPVKTIAASGAMETMEYYPAQGADGCPADPLGFVRSLKSKTVTPASGFAAAPSFVTQFRYSLMPSLCDGAPNFMVLEEESLFEVGVTQARRVTRNEYKNLVTDRFAHGRLTRSVETINGFSSEQRSTCSLNGDVLETQMIAAAHDGLSTQHTIWQHCLTGQQIKSSNADGVVIETSHDALGRVLTSTLAPGTPQAACQTFAYAMVAEPGDVFQELLTSASGAKTQTRYDGLSRKTQVEIQDVDAPHAPMREIYRARYNDLGQLSQEIATDWIDNVPKALLTQLYYDDWGNQTASIAANSVLSRREVDPCMRTESQWLEGAGKTLTLANILGKPEKIERHRIDGSLEGCTSFEYDGLGRCIEQTNVEGHTTHYRYDFIGRLSMSTLPDGTAIQKRYAEHSFDDLPTQILVNGTLVADYVAGEQTFDGLCRLTSTSVGGRIQRFTYNGAQTQPATEVTPSGKVIAYAYNPALDDQLISRTVANSPSTCATYQYDAVHAQLLAATVADASHKQSFEYFPSGRLKREVWGDESAQQAASHEYSLSGMPLSYTDVFGAQQITRYDAFNRVAQVRQGAVDAEFEYDTFGRTAAIKTSDTESGLYLITRMVYDEFSREIRREFETAEGDIQVLTQRFNSGDKLVQRVLTAGADILRDERYVYDSRGRLIQYDCAGSERPVDAAGKTLRKQTFEFDALDNIRTLTTDFEGGQNKATYHFDYADKTQLSEIRHTHPDYQQQAVTLHYNADGHQTNDEQNRVMAYDELGRLVSVSEAGNV